MKNRIKNFCKNWEDFLVKEFKNNKKMQDLQYFNYCLGQKELSIKIRSLLNNIEEKDIIPKLQEIRKDYKEKSQKIEKAEQDYYVGGGNFIGYIFQDLQKGGFVKDVYELL